MARIRTDDGIRVEGLVELNNALKEFGDEFKGEMRKTNKVVADIVAKDARAAATSLGSTAAHVAYSIRASAGAQFAGVSLGDPAAAGAEFGGGRRPTTQQFQPWRGNGENAGYFLYPTIRRDADKIETEYKQGLERLLRKTGLE